MPENAEKEPEDEVFMECVTKPCTFSELYSTIPNKISRQMANNLSVPIAFVCLLHLANEKVLETRFAFKYLYSNTSKRPSYEGSPS